MFTDAVQVAGTMNGSLANSLTPRPRRQSTDLTALDTPATITTLSRVDIDLRGDPDVNAAVTRAVGITSTASIGAANTTVAARGFGDTSVAVSLRWHPQPGGDRRRRVALRSWTVERIEVLNGPASVLYGIGGIGGSLNIVPRRPSRNAEHTLRVSAGSMNTFKGAMDRPDPSRNTCCIA